MGYRFIIIVTISAIIIAYYTITLASDKPLVITIHEIVTNLDRYEGKDVIVSGVITKISNGKSIYMLWHNNDSIILNIPREIERDLEINRDIEIEGIVIDDNDIATINVKKVRYL